MKIKSALTEDVKARRNMEAAKDLESISKMFKECMDKRMIVAEYARDRDCEGLDRKLKLLMNIERDHRLAFIHEQKTHNDQCETE